MHISGLVITLEAGPGIAESVKTQLAETGVFECGDMHGQRLPVVLDVADADAAREWHHWLCGLPGVITVDLASVHTEPDFEIVDPRQAVPRG